MHVHGSPRVHTGVHTPHAGTQCEPLSLHTHGDTHRWSQAFTPALQHFPTRHTHSHAGPAGHTCTHTHTHTHQCPQHPAGPEPASPAKHEMPAPGKARKLAAAESAPGCRQGHRQGKGEGGGQLVGLDGQRSQTPQTPPSSPIAGAQNTHHQASESIRGVSLPPKVLFSMWILTPAFPHLLRPMPGFSPPHLATTSSSTFTMQ